MKTQHTPGPWMYRKQANGSLDFFGEGGDRVILSNARLINQEANARLIAAATELLEALKDILHVMEQHEQLSGCDCSIGDQARAAIAKATGAA